MDFKESWNDTCSSVGAAAREGKLKELKKLIKLGRPVDVSDNRGWKPLHEAAAASHSHRIVEELLKHSATDVNWKTHEGETALLLACRRLKGEDALKTAKVLLKHGADANIPDNEEETPLLAATRQQNLELVKLLVLKGNADVNLCDCGHWYPIHEATSNGLCDVVQFLISSGARINVQDECQITPIFTAAQHGHYEALKLLLDNLKVTGQEYLIDQGAEDMATPLIIASQQGHLDCLSLLINYGADPSIKTTDNVTAVHLATQYGSLECLELLLKHVNIQSIVQSCLLPFQRQNIAEMSDDVRMISPLHLAVEWKRYQCLEALLNAGFPVDGLLMPTAFHVPRLPLDMTHRTETALTFAVLSGDITAMETLLKAQASVNAVCPQAISPILPAALRPSGLELKLLLSYNSDINYHRKNLKTNECLLVTLGSLPCFVRLLRLGSDPKLCFHEGDTMSQMLFLTCLFSLIENQKTLLHLFKVLLVFMEKTTCLKEVTLEASRRSRTLFMSNYNSPAWTALIESLDEPLSLKNSCRIQLRRHLLSIHQPLKMEEALCDLHLPQIIQNFLLYQEFGEVPTHVFDQLPNLA